jgi:hypothetical protein
MGLGGNLQVGNLDRDHSRVASAAGRTTTRAAAGAVARRKR